MPDTEKAVKGWLDGVMAEVTDEVIDEFATSKNEARQEVAKGMKARKSTPAEIRTRDVGNLVDPETGKPYGTAEKYYDSMERKGLTERRGLSMYAKGTGIKIGRPSYSKLNKEAEQAQARADVASGKGYQGPFRTDSPRGGFKNGVVGGTFHQGVVESSRLKPNPIKALQAGVDDYSDYAQGGEQVLGSGENDPFKVATPERNSPHPDAYDSGIEDAKAYAQGQAQGQKTATRKKPRRATSPGGPTVPVAPGYVSPTRVVQDMSETPEGKRSAKTVGRNIAGSLKKSGIKFGSKIGNALQETSLVRGFATKLARAAGNTLVDSKGNVAYDADTDTAYDKQGNVIMGTAGSPSTEVATDPDGNPILDASGNPVTKKEAAKAAKKQKTMARRQKRGMVAGRLAGAMGTASMAAGMATMMPGVGDNPVMQQIQQFMPALFGLSAVLPLLAALPGPLGLLVGAVGAVVAGMFMYNKELKKVQKEARDLGQSLTADQATMEGFAQAAGTATPSEIMDLRRQGISEQVQFAVGKTPFANQFFQGEAGTEMVSDFKTAKGRLGADAATGAVTRQLTTAISSGILSREQAAQIALELGNQLDDYGVTMAVTGEINQMFGPNGEDLINGEPIEIFIKTTEESSRAFVDNVQSGLESLQGGGGFFDKIFDFTPQQIASFTAGSLTGFIQEQQNAMDAFEVASEKRIDSLKAEKATAIEQGKDVSEINRKIAEEREKQDDQRIKALDLQKQTFLDVASTLDTDLLNFSDQELLDSAFGDNIRATARQIQNDLEGTTKEAAMEAALLKFRQEQANSGQFAGVLEQMNAGFKENLSEVYDDEVMVKAAENSLDELANLDIDIPAKLLLGSAIGTGDIDPTTMYKLLELFELGGEGSTDKYFNIIGNVMLEGGPQAQAQVDAILGTIATYAEDDQEQFEITSKFLDSIAGLEDTDLTGLLDQLQFFSTFQGLLGADSLVKFMELSPADRKKIDGSIDKMQELVDSTPDEPLEVEQVLEQNIITDPAMIQAFKDDAEFFEKLDPLQQFLYIQRFIAIQATITEDEAKAYLASNGVQGEQAGAAYNARNYSASQIQGAMADLAAEKTGATLNAEELGSAITGSDDPGSSGGGAAGSMLDSITDKLRLFRDETVNATKGWTDSMSQIQALFGGTKTISIFDGLEQQLRSLGAGENLIELIAGMDPDEFEQRKNELFNIKDGQIVSLKDAAVSIGDALNSIKIGEFQNQQEEALSAMQNQETAFQMLRDAGLDVADAYGVIADEALAAAIASGQLTDQEIDELISKVEQVREQSDISDAFENARKAIEEFNDDVMIKANVRAYVDSSDFNAIKGTMINGQVDGALAAAAIMQDESLKALMAAGRAGSEEFVTRLTQLMGSAEFLQGVFDKGYSNVQEAFRVQEAKIRDDFETRLIDGTLANYDFNDMFGLEELSGMIGMSQDEIKELFQLKDPEGVVEQAKAQIATLEYQIDDFNAELDQIQRKEDDINEKYDERIDALDKVQAANDKVNRTQQSQLSVADALSRGDIAAAARAAQEARQQEAQARIEQRKQRVEEARERELSLVRSAEGNTREEIENRIKEIKQQILEIEEKQLEPATRAIELSQILLDKQIEYDTVLGKTREAWEDIKLEIDLAKIASEDFNTAIQAALSSVEALIEAYGRLGDAIAAAYSTQPSGGGGTASTTDGDGDGGNGGNDGDGSNGETGSSYDPTSNQGNPENQKQHLSTKDFSTSLSKAKQKVNDDKNAAARAKAKAPTFGPEAKTTVKDTGQRSTYNPGGVQYKRVKVTTPYGAYYKTVALARGGMIKPMKLAAGGPVRYSMGGAVARYAMGGMTPLGSDSIPAMLTPGEFVIRRPAVQSIGKDRLEKINKTGTYNDGSVYNYNLELNVKSNSNPDEIARTVITKIKQIDAQRIRGNKF